MSVWRILRFRVVPALAVGVLALILVVVWAVGPGVAGGASVSRGHCAAPAGGGEWPSYGQGLAGDRFQPAEHRLGPATAQGLKPKFVFKVGNVGMSGDFQATPVEVGGCVYMGTSTGWVFAINADSGGVVWKTQLPVGAPGFLGTGIVGSPAVVGGRVFVNVSQASAPYTAAMDARTGHVLWRAALDTRKNSYNDASPVVFRGVVLSGFNGDEKQSATARGGYDVLDARTGKVLVHQYTIPDQAFVNGYTGGSIWATAAVDSASGYAFVGTGNPAGTKQYPTTNAILKIDLNRSHGTFGRIVAHYSGDPDAHEDLDFGGSPSLFRDYRRGLLVGELQKSGFYHTIYASNMRLRWATKIGSPSLVANGDSGATDGRRVYIEGTPPGQLVALDVNTGRQLWEAAIGDQVHYESITTADDVVYTVTSYNRFVAYDAITGAPLLKRSLSVDAGASMTSQLNYTSASVSVARDTVYLANGGAIVAYRTGAPVKHPPHRSPDLNF